MPLGTIPIRINKRRRLDLGFCITVYYPDYSVRVNRSMHRPVEGCSGMTVPTTLPPSRDPDEHGDMRLADVRHALDFFFSTYCDGTVYDGPRAYTALRAPDQYPAGAQALRAGDDCTGTGGLGLRVFKAEETELERQSTGDAADAADSEGEGWENPYMTVLLRRVHER
ncbi:hypothetical protein VTG60DRAFT_2238 [Thermothelomyces hinnuleus]